MIMINISTYHTYKAHVYQMTNLSDSCHRQKPKKKGREHGHAWNLGCLQWARDKCSLTVIVFKSWWGIIWGTWCAIMRPVFRREDIVATHMIYCYEICSLYWQMWLKLKKRTITVRNKYNSLHTVAERLHSTIQLLSLYSDYKCLSWFV